MSIFVESLVRIASYGPQIDQSHGENRLSHIITQLMQLRKESLKKTQACRGYEPLTSATPVQCSTN